ncbi:MAG: dTDP-4-dehydrorhamnose reductase [Methanobrevibacter sp.]|uniref:dTDP-4-dehydrorhamnose reductase n=1 Tax=Methanobrevibacter TaxID=2172 RepID=UPI00257EB2B1|nr:dTDP-4-dehydrorhamnose reductase [Methanobrevibacter sp.]MBR2665865.1 dTDP-4-dehydrorhamnose reductase [Methanobrevibacter sp.]MBR3197212.1 dTDP-4-dehydrorhamnose reductase [Methanobrevibacter sp.]MBR7050225.1 dTDP-4-dehydrorhamnose reductase [Methanobrevibacter sp.]
MKILITGSNGMLGHDLIEVLKDKHELLLTTSKTLDITDGDSVMDFILKSNPDIVINSAAYTDVDGCESNPDLAYNVNGEGVKNLALACREVDCPLVHISTDYVFNGQNDRPWVEDDEIGPISIYGKSKLEGEEHIKEILEKYFIVRTAWLYGVNGRNFPRTMLELAQNHSEITVVYDEVGTPTYTPDLAKGISELIETDYYGTYHLTNSGNCSWCEFARYIFEVADVDVNVIPVTASEFARPAPRPSYSVLENRNWVENGFEPLRNYKEAIKEYIELIK